MPVNAVDIPFHLDCIKSPNRLRSRKKCNPMAIMAIPTMIETSVQMPVFVIVRIYAGISF